MLSPCTEWEGGRVGKGYGAAYVNGKQIPAHRLAWERAHGPIPEGLFICHRCDNRPCVNVDHLFLGTPKDNMVDMVQKGRHGRVVSPERTARGAGHGMAKLTADSVREIRRRFRDGEAQAALGRAFGVTRHTIFDITRGRSWAHLED